MTSFQNSQPPQNDGEQTKASSISNVAPPDFLILRAGQQTPERFISGSIEEARATAQRQVRQANGSTKHVYVYQLVFCEQHESSSRTLEPEQIKEMFKPTALIPSSPDSESAK